MGGVKKESQITHFDVLQELDNADKHTVAPIYCFP